jgi:serine/threonine protein kinase
VRPSGRPVLVDFGIAAHFASREGRESLGSLGAGGGTLAYMAPEQIRGEYVDARADLYAFGCIL